MAGYVEWQRASTGETERAAVLQYSETGGIVTIAFSMTSWWLEGRLILTTTPGWQRSAAQMAWRDGAYHAEAGIAGELTRTADGVAYAGVWHVIGDKDGDMYDLFVEVAR